MNGQQERTGNPNSSYLYGPSLYRSSFSTFTTGGVNTTTSLTTSTPSPTSGPPSIEKKIRFASDSSRSKIDDTTTAKKQSYLSSSRDTSPIVSTTTATPTSGGLSALPRYTGSSFNTGYRLASLDRLAQRHKVYEKEELASVETNGIGGTTEPVTTSSTTTTPTHISYSTNLQNKRDQFFRNDSSTTNGGTPTANGGPPVSSTITMPTSAMQSAKEALLANKENRPELKHDVSKDKDKEKDRDREKDKKVSERRTRLLDGYVGFANLPNQVYRKAVKKGFEFTLMVVGESGLGKSTLINSMFLTDIYSTENPGPSQRIKKTVQVETTQSVLKEKGVNLTLTIVDTPGFGDAVDNSNCWQPVTEHLEAKFEEYLNAESRVHRRSIADGRVHCCLYFIAPSGHGLKPLDVEFMKRLHDKVNIIPVLAKADTMTPDECARFKKQIMNEIAQHKIKIYEFPDCDDEEENKLQRPLKDRVPFAVVGANTIIEIEGRKVRGRKYPWGIAEVENMEHCDFLPLRNMVIRTHMQDLKEVTNNVHYENYRCRKLAGIGLDGKPSKISNKNPLAQMEEEKKEHEAKMKKTEAEMEQVFEMKVREKKNKLKESEAELQRRHEQMRRPLEQQQKELEDKRAAFEQERQAWEQANNVTIEELRRRSLESSSKELVDGKEKNKKKKGLF